MGSYRWNTGVTPADLANIEDGPVKRVLAAILAGLANLTYYLNSTQESLRFQGEIIVAATISGGAITLPSGISGTQSTRYKVTVSAGTLDTITVNKVRDWDEVLLQATGGVVKLVAGGNLNLGPFGEFSLTDEKDKALLVARGGEFDAAQLRNN